jgi:inner membrane transporter RhtA
MAAPSKPAFPPALLVFSSMVSIQLGSAIAKPLMADLGAAGVVLLRLGFAAVILMVIQRPQWREFSPIDYRNLTCFGLTLAVMNGFYYGAIARIPIGIAVTIEFLGPLAVALCKSRRRLDLLWVALAATGIALLSPTPSSSLDPLGVLFALLGAVGWGFYIIASAKVGETRSGPEVLPLVMTMATIFLLPVGLDHLGPVFVQPMLLLQGLWVALLGTVITYSLEFAALRRMPVNVFGVMLSLEPAIASVIGFWLLNERLTPTALVAIALVSLAAGGASYSERK